MSHLLKSGSGREVRRFAGAPAREPVRTAPAAPVVDPRDAELARLAAQIERLTAAHKEDAAAAEAAVEAAREEGRSQGLAEAETREADRLAALGKALAESVAGFNARLETLDALAPALARAALAKLFDNAEGWAAPVEAMLARQLATLRRATLVAMRVSPQDFPDAEALAALAVALGTDDVTLVSDRALRAGASRIECKLGQIDLDICAQWQAMAALLDEMAG